MRNPWRFIIALLVGLFIGFQVYLLVNGLCQ